MTETLTTEASPHAGGVSAWGPLATAIHADAAGPGDPTWKDNAYLSFWDVEAEVYGSIHVSTSPMTPRQVGPVSPSGWEPRSSRSSRSFRLVPFPVSR